jgi:cytochrome c
MTNATRMRDGQMTDRKFQRCVSVVGAALVVLLVPVLLANGQTDQATGRIGRGQTIVEVYCARCHAIARSGDSPLPAAPPFRTLAGKYPIESLAEALTEGIVTGHSAMPEFVFTPQEVDAVLAFLKSLGDPPGHAR